MQPRMVRLTDDGEIHYVGEQSPVVAKYFKPRRLSIVRDVAAIVRDVLLVLLMLAFVFVGARALHAVGGETTPADTSSAECQVLNPPSWCS